LTGSLAAALCDRRWVPAIGGTDIVDGLATGRGQRQEHQQYKVTREKEPHAEILSGYSTLGTRHRRTTSARVSAFAESAESIVKPEREST
jgi:hypothetical protein